jgi:uncharacterized protein YbjT (DUF2867 family)
LKILLVGASGMIGSRVLAEATARGHHVTAVTRHPEKIAAGPNVRALGLDATDSTAVAAQARDVDVIVTATSPRGGGDPAAEARAVGDAAIAAARQAGGVCSSSAVPAASTCPTDARWPKRCPTPIAPKRSRCAACSTHSKPATSTGPSSVRPP